MLFLSQEDIITGDEHDNLTPNSNSVGRSTGTYKERANSNIKEERRRRSG